MTYKIWNSVTGSKDATAEETAQIDAKEQDWIDGAAEREAQDIINNRKTEYPSIEECVHAILDDDLVALQEKRAAVKLKYPKEGS